MFISLNLLRFANYFTGSNKQLKWKTAKTKAKGIQPCHSQCTSSQLQV